MDNDSTHEQTAWGVAGQDLYNQPPPG